MHHEDARWASERERGGTDGGGMRELRHWVLFFPPFFLVFLITLTKKKTTDDDIIYVYAPLAPPTPLSHCQSAI